MGYAVYDHKGQVDLLCSATGFYYFGLWAAKQGGELAVLGEEGYSEDVPKLVEELKAAKTDDPQVKPILERVLELAQKADGIFIVSES